MEGFVGVVMCVFWCGCCSVEREVSDLEEKEKERRCACWLVSANERDEP